MSFSAVPSSLSARHPESFAYKTVKSRMPVILTKVIDICYKQIGVLQHEHGEIHDSYSWHLSNLAINQCLGYKPILKNGAEDAKRVIGELSKFRNALTTDKPFQDLDDNMPDAEKWNQCLKEHREKQGEEEPSSFTSPWLFSECMMYRKIASILNKSKFMKTFDPYQSQKDTALENSLPSLCTMIEYLDNFLQPQDDEMFNNFQVFSKASLWSNRFDLSLSAGENLEYEHHDPVNTLHQLESNLLIDDSSIIFQHLQSARNSGHVQVDFIIDNAGFEFCSDLLLAEFLLVSKLVDMVRLHIKSIPWFVSDVTFEDVERTLTELSTSKNRKLSHYGKKWRQRFNNGEFFLVPCDRAEFWTLPRPYSEMKKYDEKLYEYLATSNLLIFKGDMNFRKLVGDLNWGHETLFETALQGFHPAALCALRTQKADVVVGLKPGQEEVAVARDSDWMVSGKFAVIQSCLSD